MSREPEFIEEASLVGEFLPKSSLEVEEGSSGGSGSGRNEGPLAIRLDRESFERRDWGGAIVEALTEGKGRGLEDGELCGAEETVEVVREEISRGRGGVDC